MNLIYSAKDISLCVLSIDIYIYKLPRYNHTKVTPARVWGSQNIEIETSTVIARYWEVLYNWFYSVGKRKPQAIHLVFLLPVMC